jgi:hypothetical protein
MDQWLSAETTTVPSESCTSRSGCADLSLDAPGPCRMERPRYQAGLCSPDSSSSAFSLQGPTRSSAVASATLDHMCAHDPQLDPISYRTLGSTL